MADLFDEIMGYTSPEKPEPQPWWEEILRGLTASGLQTGRQVGRFAVGAQKALTPDFLEGGGAKEYYDLADKTFRDVESLAQYVSPEDQRPFLERLGDRPFTTLARTAGEAVPSLVPTLAATAIGGPPAGILVGGALGFSTSAMDAFDESKRLGNDDGTSAAIAGSVGALSALLEGFGAHGLMKPFKSAFGRELTKRVARGETDKMIREILFGSLGEAATEGSQELVAAAGELLAGRPLSEVSAELDDRLAQAATGGFLAGGLTGAGTLAKHRSNIRRGDRMAGMRLLEQARSMDPEALAHFMRPRAPGEWAMEALPTGQWTTESLQEARASLEELVVPDVLGEKSWGTQRLKPSVRLEAGWLGGEYPFVELVRKGFGDKVGDEIQNQLSYSRKSTTAGRTVLDAEIRNNANETIAPPYKDLLALVAAIPESPVPDATSGRWLAQYSGLLDRQGNALLKRGERVLPDHIRKNAGMRYFEEARMVLRQVDLKAQKNLLAARMEELQAQVDAATGALSANRLVGAKALDAQLQRDRLSRALGIKSPDPFAELGFPERRAPERRQSDVTVAPERRRTPDRRRQQQIRGEDAQSAREGRLARLIGVDPKLLRERRGDLNLDVIEDFLDKARQVQSQPPRKQSPPVEPETSPPSPAPAPPPRPGPKEVAALHSELARVTKEHDDINYSEKAMADAEERLAWLQQHPQWNLLQAAAEGASTWDQHMVTMMADAEIISREQEQRILARGKHYAGFFVANPSSLPPVVREKLNVGSQQPKRLKVGLRRDQPMMLPSQASLYQSSRVQRAAHEQVNKNSLLKLVEAAPDFWEQAGVSLEPMEGIHRPDVRVRAMREGNEVPVYMPKEMVQAFESLTPVQGDVLTEGMKSYFATFSNLRRVTALLTPTFAVGQVFRDQPEAAMFAAEIRYRPYVEMARGMLHQITGSPDWHAFREYGGGMGSIASQSIQQSPDMLAEVALRAQEEDIQSTARLATAAALRHARTWGREIAGAGVEHKLSSLFHPMGRLLETLDTATRLGAYLRALDKGYTEAEAMAVSRRSAIDFALQGPVTAKWSQVLPFMGARAQGFALNREFVRRAGRQESAARSSSKAENKGWTITQATALKTGGAALMPLFSMVFLPELVHWSIHADDEEYHQQTEDWEKQKYYHWFQLDNGEWMKTARPLGYLSRIFGFSVGQALDEAYRNDPRTVENVLAVLQDEIPGVAELPVGFGAKQNLVLFDDAANFGLRTSAVPPGAEPFLVGMTGRSAWQQRLVVPQWQAEKLPPRQQGFRTTPELYRDLARLIPGNAEEAIWAATHGGEQLSRAANVVTAGRIGSEGRFPTTAKTSEKLTSPLWLEQAGQFLTGSVGSEIIRGGEAVGAAAKGEDVPLSKIPVIRNFFARSKDAPQMWPVRRVLELAEESKAFTNVKKTRGEGLSSTERKTYLVLRERVEAGQVLPPAQETRYAELEAKSLRLSPAEIATQATYQRLEKRAQQIRELLTSWHEARRQHDDATMDRIDDLILELSTAALADYGKGTGETEIGQAGSGWAAKYFKSLGLGGQ